MATTPNLDLPLLTVQQAGKENTINTALTMLDAAVGNVEPAIQSAKDELLADNASQTTAILTAIENATPDVDLTPVTDALTTLQGDVDAVQTGLAEVSGKTALEVTAQAIKAKVDSMELVLATGAGAYTGEVRAFNPSNGATPSGWTKASGMVAPSNLYDQVRFQVRPNNIAFVASSQNKAWTLTQSFDYNTGVTTTIASAPASTTLTTGGVIATDDGFLTFFGGASVPGNITMRYTAATNSWSQLTSSPASKNLPCLAELADGQVLAIGGVASTTSINVSTMSSSVHRFNPTSNTWTAVASLPFRCYGGKACRLPDGRIVFYVPPGGYFSNDGSTVGTTARWVLYNPSNDTWTEMDAPTSANHATTSQPYALADGRVVLVAPTNANSQIFNPAAAAGSQWSSFPITGPGGANATFTSALLFSKPILGAFLPCTSTIGLFLWTGGTIAPSSTAFYAVKN